jgi:hypothetical protein
MVINATFNNISAISCRAVLLITFSVWRKIDVNRYKVVGTNRIVVKGNDNMAILFSLCSASCK